MTTSLSNLDRYKNDLDSLIRQGDLLHHAIQKECLPDQYEAQLKKQLSEVELKTFLAGLPNFGFEYQSWYSEAKALIKQVLPDRLMDFISHYEKPKTRKDITYENY